MGRNSDLFKDKISLAPMVRVGTLPMRLLALRNDADLVYSDEIIDYKIANCTRLENEELKTVDFITNEGIVVFRTCAEERGKNVFQIGTACKDRALQALKLLENDIAGFDVNMGCPKEFSTKGGMGAALLDNPELVKEILTTLVENATIPISCKMRILSDEEKTISLVRMIIKTGVSAIAVHGRTRYHHSKEACNMELLKKIVCTFGNEIPIIVNGGSNHFKDRDDILAFGSELGCNNIMVARAAKYDPSVFRKDGVIDAELSMKQYLELAMQYDNHFSNSKYVLVNIMQNCIFTSKKISALVLSATSFKDMCQILGVQQKNKNHMRKVMNYLINTLDTIPPPDKILNGQKIVEMPIDYFVASRKRNNVEEKTPKSHVSEYCRKNQFEKAIYETHQLGKVFKSYLYIGSEVFTSTYLFKNKKNAEQACASVFCKKVLSLEL